MAASQLPYSIDMSLVRSTFLAAAICGFVATSAAAQRTAQEAVQLGMQALQDGDVNRADAIFREALGRHPQDAQLLLGSGIVARLQERDADAIRFLKDALRIEPHLSPAGAILGELLYRQGELDEAIKVYEVVLKDVAPGPATLIRRRLEEWRKEAALAQNHAAGKDERFAIMFDGPAQESLATRATRVLGEAFWRIGKTLGSYPPAPINVILYTKKQFHDITGAPEWAGGGFDGQIRMPVAGVSQNLPQFDRVLTHELTHAMLKSIAPNIPVWLNEGLAMHFEGRAASECERSLAASRTFVPLSMLRTSFSRLNSEQAAVAYDESAFATRVLLDRIGAGGIHLLLQDLDGGQTFETAMERFGFTFADFEGDLARRVGARRPVS
jgi:tetratricopeptide (TPR) repeat protein